MAFVFKPAIHDGSTLYELPRPVLSLRIQDSWDVAEFKVPLAAGNFLAGPSREGVNILIDGQVGTQAGNFKPTESDMFQELETLRNNLHVANTSSKYRFFIYHDTGSSIWRSFKDCTTLRFEFDLSKVQLFNYSITIHAEDPTIYTTAP